MTHPASHDLHLLFGPTPPRDPDPDRETEWFSIDPPVPMWVVDHAAAVRGIDPAADGIRNLWTLTGTTPEGTEAKEATE